MSGQRNRVRCSLVVVICFAVLVYAGSPAGGRERNTSQPRRTLQTKSFGRVGDPDDFLTDVIPDWPGWTSHYWMDKELWGNQGYIIGGPRKQLAAAGLVVGAHEEITAIIKEPSVPEPPVEKMDLDVAREKPDTHRVVKGECLWYIAGYDHIYGNPLQWPLIYKANKDKIKNPDLIYPGQVFIVPR